MKIKLGLFLVASVLLLTACSDENPLSGGQELDELKSRMKVLNTYAEDKNNVNFDKELEQRVIARMSEEEVARMQVETDLGLRGNTSGEYEEFGVHESMEPYVKRSIEKGMTIPQEGKVIEIVEEGTDMIDDDTDDLAELLVRQEQRLERHQVRRGSQASERSNLDLNRQILRALKEEQRRIESDLESRREELRSVTSNERVEQEIRILEAELREAQQAESETEGNIYLEDDDIE